MKDWEKKHEAILDLLAFLDEQIPTLALEGGASSVFFGAAGLYRCNRYLQAIDNAVENGLGAILLTVICERCMKHGCLDT